MPLSERTTVVYPQAARALPDKQFLLPGNVKQSM
jgi:hypothetical protein